MVHTKFKGLDVQSMERLYEKHERRKRQRAEQKRQHKRKEQQQQQQQQQKQAQLPPMALVTPLGQNFEVPSPTNVHTRSWTSSDLFASIGDIDFGSVENLGIAEAYIQCDFAPTVESVAPSPEISGIISTMPKPTFSNDINSPSALWSSCAPLPARPSTAQAPHVEANPSSAEELSLTPNLARWVAGQLRLTNSVANCMDASGVEVEDEDGNESSASYDANETSDDDRGSDDDDIGVENCHQEMAVPRSQLAENDPPGSVVLQVLSESNSAAHDCLESSPVAKDPFLSDSAEAPVGSLGELKESQIGGLLPTPASDDASDSGQGSHVTYWKRRGGGPHEGGCESHELRPVKRMRSRKVDNGTESPALPSRTLRALPSRVPASKSSNRLSNEIETQPCRSAGTPERSEADGPIGLVHDGKNTVRPKRSRYNEAPRDRTPTISDSSSLHLNHLSSTHDQTERWRLAPPPPVTITANPPATICHTCGFSAKHLLRMINTFEALNGGNAQLPGDEKRMDMLELFLGFTKNYATERLPYNETSTGKYETYNTTHQDHAAEAAVGPSHSNVFKPDDGSNDNNTDDNNTDDNNTDDNNSQSDDNRIDSDSSDCCLSPDSLEGNVNKSKRRRWTDWEEERLRVYIEEGKEWSWIAKRLHRSEPAVTQHWVIMQRQDKETAT
ncbi:hypothetical protein CT0861_00349 [Colletotrichum tofieldiae]|uniref:Myb-like domain-containing protein n=1 Tax=Colletotrichum tofieldiae TaxID=708197 RepID=A0A166Q5V8_9PEZI|nr:hypothetical protein CT0861_00349 [Colletotrichum tofieldiae]